MRVPAGDPQHAEREQQGPQMLKRLPRLARIRGFRQQRGRRWLVPCDLRLSWVPTRPGAHET